MGIFLHQFTTLLFCNKNINKDVFVSKLYMLREGFPVKFTKTSFLLILNTVLSIKLCMDFTVTFQNEISRFNGEMPTIPVDQSYRLLNWISE